MILRRFAYLFILALIFSTSLSGQIRIDRFLEQGRIELSHQDYGRAMRTFSRVITLDEANYEAWYYRGLTKYYQNDYAGAGNDLDRAAELNPAVAQIFLIRGIVRDIQGNYFGALEDFTSGLAIDPNSASLYLGRGTTRLRLNNFTLAIKDFNEAIRINERMTPAFINRGVARARMLDNEGAFHDFNQAILLNPFLAEAHYRKGLLYYETGKYQDALVAFGEAVQRDSANPQQYYVRALTWYEMGRKDSCLNDLTRVLDRDPRHSLSYYNRAIIRSQTGDYEGAISDYLQVNKLQPYHVLSYFNRGLLRDQTGDQLGAIIDLDRAITIYPDFARAYQARASIKRKLGDDLGAQTDIMLANEKIKANAGRSEEDMALNYADTTIHFEDLIKLNSVFNRSFNADNQDNTSNAELAGPCIINAKGRVIMSSDHDSLHDLTFELKNNSNDLLPDELSDTILLEAIKLTDKKLYNEGLELLNGFLDEHPGSQQALFIRAQVRFGMIEFVRNTRMINELVPLQVMGDPGNQSTVITDQVNYSEVIADYEKLLRTYPDLAIVHYNLALVRLYARDYEGAVRAFERAVSILPSFGEAWLNLGLTQIRAGGPDSLKDAKQRGCLALSKAGELGVVRAYGLISKYCGVR